MRSNAMRDVMDKAQVTEIDFAAKKDEGDKKPAKKAAAKKAAKKMCIRDSGGTCIRSITTSRGCVSWIPSHTCA